MYNMYGFNDFYIVLGKYKFNLIIVAICFILLFILQAHLICGCSKMTLLETFENISGKKIDVKVKKTGSSSSQNKTGVENAKSSLATKKSNATAMVQAKEAFQGMNKSFMNTGETYASYPEINVNTNNWGNPTLTPGSPAMNQLNSYKNTPLPLQDGNMFMFSQTDFKPECCNYGETYSNSMGCACMNLDSVKYLWQRGGNNVPYIQGANI